MAWQGSRRALEGYQRGPLEDQRIVLRAFGNKDGNEAVCKAVGDAMALLICDAESVEAWRPQLRPIKFPQEAPQRGQEHFRPSPKTRYMLAGLRSSSGCDKF